MNEVFPHITFIATLKEQVFPVEVVFVPSLHELIIWISVEGLIQLINALTSDFLSIFILFFSFVTGSRLGWDLGFVFNHDHDGFAKVEKIRGPFRFARMMQFSHIPIIEYLNSIFPFWETDEILSALSLSFSTDDKWNLLFRYAKYHQETSKL